jgi:high-affinity Fe2+/Pb2+ permease
VEAHEETERQRSARNLGELLQELRVAQAGVQILFGFLLAVTFTEPYLRSSDLQRGIHLVTVLFAVASVALLSAPAAWHRLLFRRGHREEILRSANTFALLGMSCLAVAMTGTVLLIVDVAVGGWAAVGVAVVVALVFLVLWFLLPLRVRR